MMIILAVALVGCGLLFVLYKLHVSFVTEGGALGMVPVLDGALLGPAISWVGMVLLDSRLHWLGWPWWLSVLSWLATTLGVGVLIVQAGRWGEKSHTRMKTGAPQS